MKRYLKTLDDLKDRNRLRTLQKPQGVDLTSNDYLGMRHHPTLHAVAIEALQGGLDLGAGGSRLLRGHTAQHEALEDFAASYFNCEKALYFSCGYQANLAIFQTLPTRGDWILFDEYIHASARDGIQASAARHRKFRHNDMDDLCAVLKEIQIKRRPEAMIWIAVESLYSMDGDFTPVEELVALANEYQAVLVVDEAHATGVWGDKGKGIMFAYARQNNLITLHTCGKALGVAGGLVCTSKVMIDTLINTARPFIYSTAPPPLQALLVKKSLEILGSAEGDKRRKTLKNNLQYTRSQAFLDGQFAQAPSQILPVMLGDDATAVQIARALHQAGFDIRAIRPPTVPPGTARLRLSLSSELTTAILQSFAQHLKSLMQQKDAA
ncbi:MAG: 8-amino-7-oxononanoate synthase [Alphaproteobacteria bacterium]|nr:8-amino-7-oxononanoate synthase [Alphaproteobacteria bacterium]